MTPIASKEYMNKQSPSGWVYIMRNPAMPNIVKIGFTAIDPQVRAKSLSRSTGVPMPYRVVKAFPTEWPKEVEADVFSQLHYCRPNRKREFFDADTSRDIFMGTDDEHDNWFGLIIEKSIECVRLQKQWDLLGKSLSEARIRHDTRIMLHLAQCMKKNHPENYAKAVERMTPLPKSKTR